MGRNTLETVFTANVDDLTKGAKDARQVVVSNLTAAEAEVAAASTKAARERAEASVAEAKAKVAASKQAVDAVRKQLKGATGDQASELKAQLAAARKTYDEDVAARRAAEAAKKEAVQDAMQATKAARETERREAQAFHDEVRRSAQEATAPRRRDPQGFGRGKAQTKDDDGGMAGMAAIGGVVAGAAAGIAALVAAVSVFRVVADRLLEQQMNASELKSAAEERKQVRYDVLERLGITGSSAEAVNKAAVGTAGRGGESGADAVISAIASRAAPGQVSPESIRNAVEQAARRPELTDSIAALTVGGVKGQNVAAYAHRFAQASGGQSLSEESMAAFERLHGAGFDDSQSIAAIGTASRFGGDAGMLARTAAVGAGKLSNEQRQDRLRKLLGTQLASSGDKARRERGLNVFDRASKAQSLSAVGYNPTILAAKKDVEANYRRAIDDVSPDETHLVAHVDDQAMKSMDEFAQAMEGNENTSWKTLGMKKGTWKKMPILSSIVPASTGQGYDLIEQGRNANSSSRREPIDVRIQGMPMQPQEPR